MPTISAGPPNLHPHRILYLVFLFVCFLSTCASASPNLENPVCILFSLNISYFFFKGNELYGERLLNALQARKKRECCSQLIRHPHPHPHRLPLPQCLPSALATPFSTASGFSSGSVGSNILFVFPFSLAAFSSQGCLSSAAVLLHTAPRFCSTTDG